MNRALRYLVLVALIAITGISSTAMSAFGQGLSERASHAESKARAHLAQKGVAADRVAVKDAVLDQKGSHVRFSQLLKGVRIYGGDIITHEKANGRFTEISGEMFRGEAPPASPSYGKAEAEQFAARELWDATYASAELVYYPQGKSLVLAYMVDISNTDFPVADPQREMVVLDAVTGEVIDRWNNLQTTAATGTGHGFYSGTVANLPIDLTSGSYYLFDVPRNGKTTDFANKTCPPTGCRNIGTVYSSTDNIFGATGSLSDRQSVGVDAHNFAGLVLNYFSGFGRSGIDNNNNRSLKWGYMVSRTHYGSKYNNAFWDGASMTYGDGDGTTYRPFDAFDVVGHEMTHGITERTSNLQYQNESGAANESFSDIFGVVIEFKTGPLTGSGNVAYPADWWIGEDLYYSNNPSAPTRGIRNMQNTHAEGDPDHYSERYTGTSDNGGVHTNSGIMNYMFYLLVAGGTNHRDTTGTLVTGIGLDKAAEIAYLTDTSYLTATSNYQAVANGFVNAAKFKFGAGSTESQQTYNAWKACGVTPATAP